MAIMVALLTVPVESQVTIYSDSQVNIFGIEKILQYNQRQLRRIHKMKNKDLLLTIRQLVIVKHLEFRLVKIKGHSGNTGNDLVDDLAKTALAKNLERFRLVNFHTLNSFIMINPLW